MLAADNPVFGKLPNTITSKSTLDPVNGIILVGIVIVPFFAVTGKLFSPPLSKI